MFILSVIIPVYNGEKYLPQCLEAIECQTTENVQIIFADDGSLDGSMRILRDYERRSRHSVQILQTGGRRGAGAARNTGLSAAAGKYIMFLDQDDLISDGYFSRMLALAESTGADAVFTGYEMISEQGKILQEVTLGSYEWCLYMNVTPWGKILRKDFLKEHRIQFAQIPLGEDVYFTIRCIMEAGNIITDAYAGYQWRQHRASYSHTAHEKAGKESDLVTLYDRLEGYLRSGRVVRAGAKEYEYFLIKTMVYQILKISYGSSFTAIRENENRVHSWMSEHYPEYQKNAYLRPGRPEGERRSISFIVFFYMVLYRWKMTGLLLYVLHLYGRVSKRC